jgi:hypothetical protein
MADRYQGRPFPDDDDRRGDQHGSGGSDPLAELARLIGQTDPFAATGRPNPAPPLPPVPRAAPRYEPQEPQYDEEPQYEEPIEEEPLPAPGPPAWMQRANARAAPTPRQAPVQEDYPSALHPLRRALPAPQYEDYPEEQAYQEPEEHADPARYDQALYGQLEGGAQDYQRDAAYPDDPYAYQDGYEEEPEEPVRNRAGGLLTIAAVLTLAVVGTGAAFAYRTYVRAPRSGDPPVIKADNTPTKVIPAPVDPASKTPDRMPAGDGSEKIVPREEKPVDVNANSAAPRVVFPPLNPNANPPSPASVATAAPPPPMPAAAPTNGTLPSSEPRKIKTLSVRGDQADAGPAPSPAAAAKPAKSAAAAARNTQPAAGASAPLSLAPDAQASTPEPRRVATLQPPPGAPNAPTNPSTGGGGYLVQVSSQKSESDAHSSYKALQNRYPAVLGSHPALIKRADLGDKGVYYRAMVGPFGTPEEASQFCGNLKTAGGQCVVQRK